MSKQLSFEEYQPSIHNKEIYLFADGIRLIENVAGLFRLADAMGVVKIFLSASKNAYNTSRLKKISRSTTDWVSAVWGISFEETLQHLPKNTSVLALEYTKESYPVAQLSEDLRDFPLVLILGSEVRGISKTVLNQADEQIYLPMYGKNSSMNVTMAAAMALYELTRET